MSGEDISPSRDRFLDRLLTEERRAEISRKRSDRYLLFTIIFASVLFFGGVSGKLGWRPLDLTVLVLGMAVLVIGLVILFTSPIR